MGYSRLAELLTAAEDHLQHGKPERAYGALKYARLDAIQNARIPAGDKVYQLIDTAMALCNREEYSRCSKYIQDALNHIGQPSYSKYFESDQAERARLRAEIKRRVREQIRAQRRAGRAAEAYHTITVLTQAGDPYPDGARAVYVQLTQMGISDMDQERHIIKTRMGVSFGQLEQAARNAQRGPGIDQTLRIVPV